MVYGMTIPYTIPATYAEAWQWHERISFPWLLVALTTIFNRSTALVLLTFFELRNLDHDHWHQRRTQTSKKARRRYFMMTERNRRRIRSRRSESDVRPSCVDKSASISIEGEPAHCRSSAKQRNLFSAWILLIHLHHGCKENFQTRE